MLISNKKSKPNPNNSDQNYPLCLILGLYCVLLLKIIRRASICLDSHVHMCNVCALLVKMVNIWMSDGMSYMEARKACHINIFSTLHIYDCATTLRTLEPINTLWGPHLVYNGTHVVTTTTPPHHHHNHDPHYHHHPSTRIIALCVINWTIYERRRNDQLIIQAP